MKKFVIGLILLGLASQGFSQEEETEGSFKKVLLTGVTVSPIINREYLDKVQEGVYSPKVLDLENVVARYDVTMSPIYKETANGYKLSFKQPKARIIASFDKNGSLLWTFEKFKDIACPENVRNTLFKEYAEWKMMGNAYFVHYSKDGELRKVYKIALEKGDNKQFIKLDSDGEIFEQVDSSILFDLVKN